MPSPSGSSWLRLRSVRLVAVLVGLAVSVAACGSGASAPPSPAQSTVSKPAAPKAPSSPKPAVAAPVATATKATHVVVEVPNVDLNYFPLTVAQRHGFFAQHGVQVKIERMPPPVALDALLNNQIQFIGVGGTALQAAWKGLPVRLVAVIADRSQYVLAGPSGLKRVAQLRGKGIGVNNPADAVSQLTMAALQHYGLGPRQYTFVGLGAARTRIAALKAGTVAAAMLEPGNIQLAQKDGLHILFNISDVLPPVPVVALATSTRFISQHPAAVRGVIAATVEAVQYIRAHPAASKAEIAKEFNLSPAGAAAGYATAVKAYSIDGRVSAAGVREAIELGVLMASRTGTKGKANAFPPVPARLSKRQLARLENFSFLPAATGTGG